MSTQTELKPIPSAIPKGRIYRLFNSIPRETVQAEMYWAIEKCHSNPNVPLEKALSRRSLMKKEIEELFRLIHTPEGYEKPPKVERSSN
ncbi:MAG: hypothetical protein WCD31_09730 [Gillisia sp.]